VNKRGKYIVIEGSDGTGKSLQAIRLTDHLEKLGIKCLRVFNDETGRDEPIQEPGGTPTANKIRAKIKDKNIERTPWENVEWFTEARVSIWNEAIKPALEAGIYVVTSRSWISTMAYQGYGEGESLERIREYTQTHVGEEYMNPDMVFILAMQDEVERRKRLDAAQRNRSMDRDTLESMPAEFQANMQSGYIRFADDNNIPTTDASGTPDEVEALIWDQVKKVL